MEHVAYKGTGPAMIDILGGTIDLLITTPPSAAGHLREEAGQGPGACCRHRATRCSPTSRRPPKSGVPGFELEAWTAIYAPAGTPQPIIDKLAAAMERVVKSEAFEKSALEQGTYAVHMGPKELGDVHRRPRSPTGAR